MMFTQFIEMNSIQQAQIDAVDRLVYVSLANGGHLNAIIERAKSMPVPPNFNTMLRVSQIVASAKQVGYNVR